MVAGKKIGILTAENEKLKMILERAQNEVGQLTTQIAHQAQELATQGGQLDQANQAMAQMALSARQAAPYKAISLLTFVFTASVLAKYGYDHYVGSESTPTKVSGGVSASSVPPAQEELKNAGEVESNDEFSFN